MQTIVHTVKRLVKKIVCFALDEEEVEALDRIAQREGISRKQLLERLFRECIELEIGLKR